VVGVFNTSGTELLVILLVALIVLGPEKLPEAARKVGNVMRELRRMSSGFQAEVRDALAEPIGIMNETMNTVKSGFNEDPAAAAAASPTHPAPVSMLPTQTEPAATSSNGAAHAAGPLIETGQAAGLPVSDLPPPSGARADLPPPPA
jgi:sec-independent protein translocase protein TatB